MPPRTTPASQLAGFLREFTPEIAARMRRTIAQLRRLLPPSFEMVYDNYNFLVVGFSPTPRPSHAILSVAAYARGVGVCFLHGARLADPDRVLTGTGRQVRSIKIVTGDELADSRIRRLVAAAVAAAPQAYAPKTRRKLVIRSISPRRRPRRPPS